MSLVWNGAIMKALEVKDLSQWFGNPPFHVLDEVNLNIDAGQIVAMVGPSGCGKSTLLKAILGTHLPKRGEALVEGNKVTGPSADVGIVYQDYTLYPFLNARENVAFGLDMHHWSFWSRIFKRNGYIKARDGYLQKADAMLDKFQLSDAKDKYPHEMSGGMRQRVAVAQALIMKPKVLLLDEPFGALDEAIREELQVMLLHLYQDNLIAKAKGEKPPYTIFMVTHELKEAIYVSDRVIGLTQHYKEDNKYGAKIVYDKKAPVFHPHDPKEYEMFEAQIEELKEVVLGKKELENHKEFVTFWDNRQEKKAQEIVGAE